MIQMVLRVSVDRFWMGNEWKTEIIAVLRGEILYAVVGKRRLYGTAAAAAK